MYSTEQIPVSRFKITRNVYVFSFCLLLALFFWLLNVLSKSYTTVLMLPVVYDNMPAKKVAMNLLPESFAITAEVSGYSLLIGSSGEKDDTLRVDANNFRPIKRNGKQLQFYHVSPLLKQITANNYSSYIVKEVLIDTLFIDFDKLVTKALAIKPNIKLNLSKHHVQHGEIQLLPSVIKVTGPRSVLDSLSELQSDSLTFNDVTENLTTSLSFPQIKDKRFSLSPKNALATINIEKITESTVEIPVTYINVPNGITLKTFPNKVKVTYLLSISDFEKVIPSDFEVIVDYNDIDQNNLKLNVKERNSPSFANVTRIEPGRLEYIIKK